MKNSQPKISQPSFTLTGEVMSVSGTTARVRVTHKKLHPLYLKRYTVHRQYLADVRAEQKLNVGDQVTIARTRPLSKRKFWRVSQ